MWSKFVSSFLCHNGAPTQFLCTNALFLVAGFSKTELNMNNLTVIIGHVPAGASWKQVVHFGQGYMNPGNIKNKKQCSILFLQLEIKLMIFYLIDRTFSSV